MRITAPIETPIIVVVLGVDELGEFEGVDPEFGFLGVPLAELGLPGACEEFARTLVPKKKKKKKEARTNSQITYNVATHDVLVQNGGTVTIL
jgi:hypothetical protein